MKKLIFSLAIIFTNINLALAQPNAPCTGDTYGTSADRSNIATAMYQGSIEDSINAINTGKSTRGDRVGCSEGPLFNRITADTNEPSLSAIETLWAAHQTGIANYNENCAQLGREWPAAALGALYAQLAGYNASSTAIQAIVSSVEGTQYSSKYAPNPLVSWQGVYGFSTDLGGTGPCARGGVVGNGINTICNMLPQYCVQYTDGLWAGKTFLIRDFFTAPDPFNPDGGMAYDHGWSSALMLESILQADSSSLITSYDNSHSLAATWSRVEPAVFNHNYTAKNIWVLAQRYGLSGEPLIKEALMDKLERNLKPGVLMDLDMDGMVDGMSNQPFSELVPEAQTPGRYWDGHNSAIWYTGMNAWGLTEAYVALRDRGDTIEANQLRPYAIATLDNIAAEIISLGVPDAGVEAIHPVPYALLIGLWKIAAFEQDTQTDWENALWAIFNTGYMDAFAADRRTANLGLLLAYKSNTPYTPLALRAQSGSALPIKASNPNPSDGSTGVNTTIESLSWSPSANAVSYDVYLGLNTVLGPNEFQRNVTTPAYSLETLTPDAMYFWRIDPVNLNGITTGDTWSFTTQSQNLSNAESASSSGSGAINWLTLSMLLFVASFYKKFNFKSST